jgi:CRISPR-associated protein Cas2
MYVILVYDVGEERVARACKFCRRFLTWVQNSVFEGELTVSQLKRVESGLKEIMELDKDSALIYVLREERWMDRRSIGVKKGEPTNLL